ncbi:bifunctional DNA primase/polymerase [Nonomuraea sp. NPDC050540]|uniref:bifunctional DNA primase/polymerase n=1 Tax=Nonomuraea sp. NPDC050540 TaxID=3364367 RepID=UPI00378DB3E9
MIDSGLQSWFHNWALLLNRSWRIDQPPSGGLHLYLAVPPGVIIGSTAGRHPNSPLGPGIDTRGPGRGGRGGYLVGPGSIVDGRPYTIERDQPIATCPAWLANLLALPATPAPHAPARRSS